MAVIASAFAQGAALDTVTADIAPVPATAAAGAVGKAADSGHVHPQPPMFAPTGLTGSVVASRYVGATASGAPGSGAHSLGDYTVDQTGSFWICTTAGTPGTFTQVVAGSVVGGVPVLDSTAANIAPDGQQAAGAVGKAADSGHVHPEHAYQALYLAHSGALAETFPRWGAIGTPFSSPVSGTVYCAAIPLQKGITVANITLITGTAPETGGSH